MPNWTSIIMVTVEALKPLWVFFTVTWTKQAIFRYHLGLRTLNRNLITTFSNFNYQ